MFKGKKDTALISSKLERCFRDQSIICAFRELRQHEPNNNEKHPSFDNNMSYESVKSSDPHVQ